MSIKAISVKQPYAWALVTDIEGSTSGNKVVENRNWKTDYRGPLLIVSSQRSCGIDEFRMMEEMTGIDIPGLESKGTIQYPVTFDDPYMQGGMILGVVDMIACLEIATYERAITYADGFEIDIVLLIKSLDDGSFEIGDEISRTKSPWATGKYCHVYANVRRLPPTRATRRLGLYELKTIAQQPAEIFIERNGVFVR